MKSPTVSVLMPVYNGERYLREAIESILNQTFSDFEFLIINDGSDDGSEKIIINYNDDRIKYIKNSSNIGLIATLNKGIQLAMGKYLARMDADDISFPERIKKQVLFLDSNPSIAVVATKMVQINEKGEEAGYWAEDMRAVSEQQINNLLPQINCIGHPTVMMRKQIVEKYGYNSKHIYSEDWGLWLTLLSDGYSIAKIDEILLKYRIHERSITYRVNQKSAGRKIVRFKFAYLKDKIKRRNLKNTDKEVFKFFIKDFVKYKSPAILILFFKAYQKRPLRIAKEFIYAYNILRKVDQTHNLFFFPYYHTGGAEQVHSSILKAGNDKRAIVFFTERSTNNALLNEFKQSAIVLDVYHLVHFSPAKKWLIKKIKNIILKNEKLVLLGCNSKFYYELIPFLPPETNCIDLFHAFVHSYEDGPEKWSLPIVPRLSTRVVINRKTINDFEKLYVSNHIPQSFLNRIICITNFTEATPFILKSTNETLKVIYIGRGGEEKRIYLISKVASCISNKKLPVEFHFVGNIGNSIPADELQYCILHGEIIDQKELQKLYNSSHILAIASSREGFPMVIMEAMMNGVVPIVTNVGGIPEHLIDHQNGILVENGDAKEIVEAFTSSIEHFYNHRDKLNELALNAHQYALHNFKKEVFVKSYQKLLAS